MVQSKAATAHADNVTYEVVKRVSEVEDVDPLEVTPPLNEVIDPDALESLFAKDRGLGKVIFNYAGYEVSVFSDGYVSVKSRDT
ncbi:HalOD1 output domain-containing protein [Halorubrum pallidum]|uniref:HalOD1 output domain-containing protein n=1 Tax=Halorubrum pallidum TaxID=1526114 RepID=A0ABD5T6I0_9EURY